MEGKSRKPRLRFLIPILVILAIFLLIFVYPSSPFSPLHMCTLIGCSDALEITLSHEPPVEYIVEAQANDGEPHSITCTPGEVDIHSVNGFPGPATCSRGTITFRNFSPAELTIDITWDGGSYSTTARPDFAPFWPNGRFCAPKCQLGKLRLELP